MRVQSATRPNLVTIEKTHGEKLVARLTENIVESTVIGEDGGTISVFNYDEYVFGADWSEALADTIRRNPKKFLRKAKG